MKKMVIVTTTIYPDLWWGELYMLNLAKEFAKIYDVTVLCISLHKGVKDCIIEWVKINYLPKCFFLGKIFPSIIALFCKIKKINPDIIYSSSPGIEDFWLVVMNNLFFKKKLAMTYHGSFSSEKIYINLFMKAYYRWVIPFYDVIIVTTQKYLMFLEKLWIKNLHYVPCWVEKEKISFDRNWFNIKNNKLLFVAMLTSMHQHKRLSVLLEAMKELPEFQLDIVWDGDMKDFYQKQAKDLSLKNVNFCWIKSGEELVSLYKNSSIFILPSNSVQEGFWIVLLEALWNGTKIIVWEKCGGAFLIEEEQMFGSTYDGSVSSLVKTIKLVHQMEGLDFEKTKKKISSYFWESIAKKILDKLQK